MCVGWVRARFDRLRADDGKVVYSKRVCVVVCIWLFTCAPLIYSGRARQRETLNTEYSSSATSWILCAAQPTTLCEQASGECIQAVFR